MPNRAACGEQENSMNIIKKERLFLQILKASLGGINFIVTKDFQPLTEREWLDLFLLAQTHKVLPLIYEAVYELPQLQSDKAPFMAAIKKQVLQQVMLQTMKTGEFLKLNEQMLQAGVKPLVVKGIICRSLYTKPDHRQSSDEDLLVLPEELSKCHETMKAFGMVSVDNVETMKTSYEVSYRKGDSPLYIELHRYLFAPESNTSGDWNRFFEGAHNRAIREVVGGMSVYTLDYTDHMFYLICHAFKHFLHSGFGIRQVCDMVLFANTYGSQLDWEKIVDNSLQIRADKFAAAVFQIGEKYLTFDCEKACYPKCWREMEIDELPLLKDLLHAGVYGGATRSRRHSSNITLNAVSAKEKGATNGAVLKTIFPSAKALKSRYTYLHTNPFLLPIAWVSRIVTYIFEISKEKNNSATDAIKIGNQRVELLKKYGVIEE